MVLVTVGQGEGKDDGEQGGDLGAGGRPDTPVPDLHAAMPLCPGAAAAPKPPLQGSSPWVGSHQEGQGFGSDWENWSQYRSHPIPSHLPPLHLPKLDIAMKKD